MSTSTVELEQIVTTSDPAKAAHIVMVPPDQDDETPQAYVLRTRIEGLEVEALCGHRFVPQRNPQALPVCETCRDIYEAFPGKDADGRGELPDA